MKPGDKIRVTNKIVQGFGDTPKPGTVGRILKINEDGTVIVTLDLPGKRPGEVFRAMLASWEVEPCP